MRIVYLSLALFLVLVSFSSCSVQPKPVQEHLTIERPNEVQEGILFLNMLFTTEEEDYSVKVTSAQLASGTLKNGKGDHGEIAVILKGVIGSDTVFVENPLRSHFEEYSENGEIKRIEVELEEAEIFVRMNFNNSYKKLIVRDLKQDKNKFACGIQ